MGERRLEELFERFRREADLEALAEVFDRTAERLLKVARHLVRDEAQAEDLVQATFLAAIEHAERFDASRELVPWLVGILTKKAQLLRSLAERAPDPGRLAERSTEDPAHDTELREFMATLERALERVPDAYRQVLRIHLAEGKGAEEIARELDRPAGTVRVQLHRGLKHLRRKLPAGFALGGLVVLSAPRGLAAMRRLVLGRAGALAKAGAAGAAGVSTAQILGGVLVGKKIAVAAGIVIVASGALWVATRDKAPAKSASAVRASGPAQLEVAEVASAGDPKLAGDPSTVQREPASPAASAVTDDPYGSLDMEWVWADGTPASGIGVGAEPMGEDHPSDHLVYDITDEHGHLTFEHLHESKVEIQSDRGCSSENLESSVVRGRRTSVRFTVPAGEDVSGKVVDLEERPVPGALVWITRYAREAGVIVAQSAADGSYLVRAAHSSCCLFATADRSGSSLVEDLRDRDPHTAGTIVLDLKLRGECGAIEGVVRDPEGKPIEGAWVTIRCERSATLRETIEWPQVWMPSASDGAFRFAGLHKGRAEVEVDAHGYAVWIGKALLEEGRTTRVDVGVERGFTVEGTVRTAEGLPIAGATVHHGPTTAETVYVWRPQLSTKTSDDGRYHLGFVPSGVVKLVAESRNPKAVLRAAAEVTGRSGDALTWDAVLREYGKIVGRVVDESGRPLEGWTVETGTRAHLEFYPRSTKSDAQGRFEILDCADVPFLVAAYPPGKAGQYHALAGALEDGVSPGKGEILLTVTSASKPSAYLSGRIVDDQGKLVEGAQVVAHNEGTNQGAGATTAKEDGGFRIGPLPSGRYTLHVDPKDLPPLILDGIEIAPDEQRDLGTITLKARGRFELVLRLEDGSIVDRPSIMLMQGRYAHFLETDDGFTFKSEELYPGTYTLFPIGQNIATEQRTIDIASGDATRVELRLRAGVPQSFEFLPPRGEKAPDEMRVVIRDSDGKVLLDRASSTNMSNDGTSTPGFLAGFAPGRYTYEAISNRWECSGSFEIGATTTPWGMIHGNLVRRR
jgi:RNA polymerase sigma-70 factor (ECF subfamily)